MQVVHASSDIFRTFQFPEQSQAPIIEYLNAHIHSHFHHFHHIFTLTLTVVEENRLPHKMLSALSWYFRVFRRLCRTGREKAFLTGFKYKAKENQLSMCYEPHLRVFYHLWEHSFNKLRRAHYSKVVSFIHFQSGKVLLVAGNKILRH